ncbi:MAG TPA: ABC transporter permease, partial [Ohtaekwangia sp.]|nr:ABC transporter permease [Ohtaekwangia sp.]
MLKNYFTIAWRSLTRQKLYASIKVFGFATGIAACLLILLFVRHELSYDRHYEKVDRIYRVVGVNHDKGRTFRGVHFPAPLASAIKDDYPEVENVARVRPISHFGRGNDELRRADRPESFHEEGLIYADHSLFEMMDVAFIRGNAMRALTEPRTIVITERKASKYFPGEDPIGKVLMLNNDESRQYTITGVIANLPTTSHLQYDFVMSLAGMEFWPGEQTNWGASNYYTYLQLREGSNPATFPSKLLSIYRKYFIPSMLDYGDKEGAKRYERSSFELQALPEIYFNPTAINDDLSHGDIRYIWLFSSIAAFILVIACINFVNLSTAKSANRAREVGLRKVAGSVRSQLVGQFLMESLIYSALSFAVALLMSVMLLPYFNALVGKSLVIPWAAWWLLPGLAAGIVIVGFLAGLYPSFYLSAFRPIEVLKGHLSLGGKSATVRGILVVFQFTTSIVLIISTLVVYRQMAYIMSKKIGYNKDQVLIIQGTHTLKEKVSTFKQELLRLPNVEHVSVSSFLPVTGTERNQNQFREAGHEQDDPVRCQIWTVDQDYIATLGITLSAGRNFSHEIAGDSQAMIINRDMAASFGWEDPVGKQVTNGWATYTITGMMEDFHFESLKERIKPLSLVLGSSTSTVMVKVKTEDLQDVIQSVSGVWSTFMPNQPVRYSFLNENYARMYQDVKTTRQIFTVFALLAVLVACLGLFGLSAFMI